MRRGSQRGATGRPLTRLLLPFTLGLLAVLATASAAVAFTDTSSSPYTPAINGLADRGIVQGFGDGTFAPEEALTRAQFAKIVVLAYKFPNSDSMTTPFVDLIANESTDLQWRAYIAGAYARHITLGTTATTFSPWASVTRAQAVSMVVRAMQNRASLALQPVPADYQCTWGSSFDPVHGANARIAEYNHLLDNLPLTGAASDPWAPITRGEEAQLIWNMMNQTETAHPHVARSNCAGCHQEEHQRWATTLHAASPSDVLLNVDHNTNELLVDECLSCHTPFQAAAYHMGDFVQPLDQTGPWHLVDANTGKWQAIKCEVCHDPTSTAPARLAFYNGVEQKYEPVKDSVELCEKCHQPGTDDSRDLKGSVHEGMQCATCHFVKGTEVSLDPHLACAQCHPQVNPLHPDVTKLDTTYLSKDSPNNIHFVSCLTCHPSGPPTATK